MGLFSFFKGSKKENDEHIKKIMCYKIKLYNEQEADFEVSSVFFSENKQLLETNKGLIDISTIITIWKDSEIYNDKEKFFHNEIKNGNLQEKFDYKLTLLNTYKFSFADEYKKLKRYWNRGAYSEEMEELENYISSIKLYYFNPGVDLDIPSLLLEKVGHFINDPKTLEFILKTPFSIYSESADRYDDILMELKDSKKGKDKAILFRKILESKNSLENIKNEVDVFYKNNKKYLDDYFNLSDCENWKLFKKEKLNFSDYILALSYENYGNPKSFVLYLNGYRTLNEYLNLTEETLIKLNIKVKKTQTRIFDFVNFYKSIQDIRDIWLFSQNYKWWKELYSINDIECIQLNSIEKLI